MENHHFLWVIQLFLWPFSIANCEFTRGYIHQYPSIIPSLSHYHPYKQYWTIGYFMLVITYYHVELVSSRSQLRSLTNSTQTLSNIWELHVVWRCNPQKHRKVTCHRFSWHATCPSVLGFLYIYTLYIYTIYIYTIYILCIYIYTLYIYIYIYTIYIVYIYTLYIYSIYIYFIYTIYIYTLYIVYIYIYITYVYNICIHMK